MVTAAFGLLAALRRRRYIQDAQGGPRRDALRQAVDEAGMGILEEVKVKGKGEVFFLMLEMQCSLSISFFLKIRVKVYCLAFGCVSSIFGVTPHA